VSEQTGAGDATDRADGGAVRVSTLELFFDLVFVFIITQLTHAFAQQPSWATAGKIVLLFVLTWWMYSGYVWLTNEVAPRTTFRRSVLLVGMFGFFAVGLAVPDAVHGSGLTFGLAFLGVTAIHSILFRVSGGPQAAVAIMRIAPINLASAALVVAGGFIAPPEKYWLWLLAVALQVVIPKTASSRGFVVRPAHYCERHGGVLIIAIGESVVGVGSGLAGHTMDLAFFAQVALGLCLTYVLWWAYFGADDEHAEHALTELAGPQRARAAVFAYGYTFCVMLIGIVFVAAGLGMTIGHADAETTWPQALALSGGMAVYCLGLTAFRGILRLPRPWMRGLAAVGAVATVPIGVVSAMWIQLAVLIVVVYGLIIADDLVAVRSGERSSYLDLRWS
jgi:low temperature requirement protein LtrA